MDRPAALLAHALTGGGFEAAPIATLPGAWLAAHGLLDGIALATDDDTPDERGGGDRGDAPTDGGGDGDDDAGAGDDGAPLSTDAFGRVPY
ncbi:hypothetical protein [Halobaculum lipolyticum]|uniref:Uncharacterized protein n=1 Tax=Halobaculum lipolyticum TaxID=3032001 RepID=A0ABD5WCI3_9EURY|nr:hypothetical protein [Halobaculum sp. DT31]